MKNCDARVGCVSLADAQGRLEEHVLLGDKKF